MPLESYLSEIKKIEAIKHPNILGSLEYKIVEYKPFDLLYVVTEIAEQSLQTFITNKKEFNEVNFFEMVLQMIEGLQVCHKQSIIHFDLKPDNMLLFRDKTIKIADFGSAKEIYGEGTMPILTAANTLEVTNLFSSPEMIDIREKNPDKLKTAQNWNKMDVYSLGLTIINLLGLHKKDFTKFKKEKEPNYSKNLQTLIKEKLKSRVFCAEWEELFMKMLDLNVKTRYDINDAKKYLTKIKISSGKMIQQEI